jgi:hypothetical protein
MNRGHQLDRVKELEAEVERLREDKRRMAQDWLDYHGPARSGSGMGAADEKANLAGRLNDAARNVLAEEKE